MALGFALVHPQRLSQALVDNFPEKIAWDDGADLTLAAAGIDLGDHPLQGFLSQLQVEALDLLGQLQGLLLPGGSFAFITDTFTGQGDGLGAWLQRIGAFLAELDPLHFKATLHGHVDAFFAHFPGFDLSTLDERLRRLAQRALDALRDPLLGGRDDGAAHRAYRAAALLLARLEPLFEAIEGGLGAFDLAGQLKAALSAAIDQLPQSLLSGFAQVGRILRDDLGGLVASASFSVSVTGPSGLVAGTPTHRDDADPQPFAKGHWLWWIDLLSSGVALFWSIWGFQRARGTKRPTEWIEFLLATIWRLFRDTVRLFVQPDWLSKEASGFVRMLFSEWGDFFVRLVLMLIGSIEDMVAWSNFVMSFGNRFLKWFTLELQPRIVYQFLRSVWYLRSWHDDTDTSTRGDPRFARVIWAGWAPTLLIAMLIGLLLPGESYDLQAFFADGHGGATAGLILSLVFQLIGMLVIPWVLMGEDPFRSYAYDSFDFIALTVATFLVFFIGVETLAATNVGETAGNVLRIVLYIIFGLTMGMVIIGQAVQGASAPGASAHWFEVIGSVQGWFVAILGGMGIGLVTMIIWWFVRRDGEDQNNDFAGLSASNSPYRLPYPRGDQWFCGQGFHGIFSHTWRSAYEPGNADNLFAHDFNNAFGKPACAARTGFVQQVNVTNVDGGGTANRVQLQHWDWVDGYDCGTTDERELSQALYLHLAQNHARCAVGQLLLQGYNLADIDDTGISALNHLHFQVFANVARTGAGTPSVTQPTLFADSDARGFRSFGHIEGKLKSLAYYTSENVGSESDAVTTTALTQPMTLTAVAVEPTGHTHSLVIGPEQLGSAGLPASLTLMTSESAGHAHAVTLSSEQLQQLLARSDQQTAAATGPVGPLTNLAAAPLLVSHQHTLRIADGTAATQTLSLTTPPGGRLIADAFAPLDLIGGHVAVDVDGRAANHWLFGANRPVIAGTIALDRGPTGAASTRVGTASTASGPTSGATLSSARLAAAAWTNAWPGVVVRPQPVLVLETRARGTGAQLELSGAGLAIWNQSTPVTSSGVGAIADADALALADLVPLVQAALAAGPGALPVTATLGATLEIRVSGSPVASFAGSSARIASVMASAYDAASGRLFSDGALPLSAGRLLLDGHVVPLMAAPARLRLERAAARLDPADLRAEPLQLSVLGADHRLSFRSSDVGADAASTLDRVAVRIAAEVDGVRAYRDGDAVVVETVAAGPAATLTASKGAFSSAPVNGGAPSTRGVTLQDSCAVTPAELRALIEDARERAGRPAAPVASVTVLGSAVVVELLPGTTAPVIDLVFGWTAEVVPAAGSGGPQLRLTPAPGMPDPMWLDVSVGANSWRIAIDAYPARIDLPPSVRAAGGGDTLSVTTSSGLSTPSLPAGASLVDQLTVLAAVPFLTARIAWRWSIEGARFQAGDLRLTAGSPSALPGMGVLGPAPATRPATGHVNELVDAGATGVAPGAADKSLPGIVGASPDDDAPAYSVALASNQVTLSARTDLTLSVTLDAPGLASDPTGLAGSGATRTSVAISPGLTTHQALRWQVQLLRGSTLLAETWVQLAAAPAKARAQRAAGATWTDTTGASQQLELVGERAVLTIIVTLPGTPDVDVSMPVDLTGAPDIDEVIARIAREATLVDVYLVSGVLHLQTRGAGTGYRLRLEGASTLASLGFDPAVFGAAGTLAAQGGGQVRDLALLSAEELRLAFETAAGAAAWLRVTHFTAAAVSGTVQLRTLGAPITLSAEPQSLLDALAPIPVAGGVDIVASSPLALQQGIIRVLQGAELRQVLIVVGSRAAVQADAPLPTAAADISSLLTTIAGQALRIDIDGLAAPTWIVPAGLADLDALLLAMRRHFVNAHVRRVQVASASHLCVASRRRGRTSAIVVSAGPVATALGFTTQLHSQTGGQDPGLGTFDDLAAVDASMLASALTETAVEAGQGVLTAVASTTGVTLTPNIGQISWTAPSFITSSTIDPGGSTLWAAPAVGGATPLLQGPTLTHAWSSPGPLVAQPLEFRVTDSAPTGGNPIDRTLTAALWANPARLGPWTLPADLSALDGHTLRLLVDGANIDIAFAGLSALASSARPAAVVAAIESAADGRVRAFADTQLRIESTEDGSLAALALGSAPANDVRSLLGDPAPGGATGSGNVARLSSVSGDEIAAAVRTAFVRDADPARDAQWSTITPDNVNRRLMLSSQKTGTASCVVPIVLPAALRMRRSMERAPAHGGAVVLPRLQGNITLDGSLFIALNTGNTGPRAIAETIVEVRFAAGSYSPRRVWLRIDEELQARGVGMAGIYPDGDDGSRIAIQARVPGLQGSVKVPADGSASTADVVSKLVPSGPLFGRGWPGIGGAANAAATGGLRTANSGAGLVASRTWSFTPSGGGAAIPFQLTSADAVLSQLAARLDAVLAAAGVGIARLHETDGCVYVELIDAATSIAVFDGTPPTAASPASTFGQPALPPPRVGAMIDVWVDTGLQLRFTQVPRTCRLVAFVSDGTAAGRALDPGWVRLNVDGNGVGQSTPNTVRTHYGVLTRAEGSRSDGYRPAGEMLVSTGLATVGGAQIPIVHQARYWFQFAGAANDLGPIALPSGEILVEVASP